MFAKCDRLNRYDSSKNVFSLQASVVVHLHRVDVDIIVLHHIVLYRRHVQSDVRLRQQHGVDRVVLYDPHAESRCH